LIALAGNRINGLRRAEIRCKKVRFPAQLRRPGRQTAASAIRRLRPFDASGQILRASLSLLGDKSRLVWGDWCQGLFWIILSPCSTVRRPTPRRGERLDGQDHSGGFSGSREPLLRTGFCDDTEGSSPSGANFAPQTCIRPIRGDRNHDAVVRIGGEAPRRRAHSKPRLKDHVHYRVAVTSARHLRFGSRQKSKPQNLSRACLQAGHHAVGRRSRPAGASPVVASRQSAMRSLRASATIMVLRVPPRASAVRFLYHSASAPSF